MAASARRSGLPESPLWDERPHGGYYTQDDLREIVAYAAERHITVVPEIDMPGHSQAAIAAYPELGNADVVDTAALGVLDPLGRQPATCSTPTEATLRFYEDVLDEMLDIFPGTVRPHRRRRVPQGPVAGLARRAGADRGARAGRRGRAAELAHPALRPLARRRAGGG